MLLNPKVKVIGFEVQKYKKSKQFLVFKIECFNIFNG